MPVLRVLLSILLKCGILWELCNSRIWARSDVQELSVTETMLSVALEQTQKTEARKITSINLAYGEQNRSEKN